MKSNPKWNCWDYICIERMRVIHQCVFPECEVDLAKIRLSYVLEPDKRFLHLFYTTYVL
jgi:hypothetical protein